MSEAGRFRYVSFHERLQDVSIDLSRESESSWGASRLHVAGLDAPASAFAAATSASNVAQASDPNSTAFGVALREWGELNLSLPFQAFSSKVSRKAQSLVLLLHHRDEIAEVLDQGLMLDGQNWLAWDALLDLVPRLAFDLGSEFLPVYPKLLHALLRASTQMDKNVTRNDEGLAARLVERAFHSAAWLFRAVSSIMIRSADADLLLDSWAIVQKFLGKGVRSHTRRFATEAFAHLVRKAPHKKLDVLVPTMLDDASTPNIEHGVAATFANSCEAAAHALHSRTPALLEIFLRRAEHKDRVRRIGTHVFTAFVHHCHAPQMTKALDVLIQWTNESMDDEDELHTLLLWLTHTAARKGTRIADDAKGALFALMRTINERLTWTAEHAPLLQAYCTLLVILLPVGRVQDAAGAGTDILKAMAARPATGDFAVAWAAMEGVCRALADSWQSFRAFVLPMALEATAELLGKDRTKQDAALLLLADLEAHGHLAHLQSAPPTSIVLRWIRRTRQAVDARLAEPLKEADAGHLAAIRLATHFSTSAKTNVAALVQGVVALQEAADTTQQATLGALLSGAVDTAAAGNAWTPLATLFEGSPSVAEKIISHTSHAVLVPLAELIARGAEQGWAPPNAPNTTATLRPVLLAADRECVRAALRILAAVHAAAPFNVYDIMLATEEMPLDVPNVTARNVKLRQAQREAFKALRGTDPQLQSLITYTVGTLKVNLKPIWKESRATLVALAARLPDEVWKVSFEELEKTVAEDKEDEEEEHDEDDEDDEEQKEDKDADEYVSPFADEPLGSAPSVPEDKNLDDPQLRARIESLHELLPLSDPRDAAQAALDALFAPPHVRFDALHYADQLLLLYEEHAVLAEKHNTPFVDHVLAAWPGLVTEGGAPAKFRVARLNRYLDIFAEFKNPRAMHCADTMRGHFVALCAHPEGPVQRGALACLLTWKDAWLVHHEERLRALLDPAKFRETLASTNFGVGSEQFATDRASLMPIVLRLLYGLMVSRRAVKTSGAGQHARRTAILGALYDCSADELRLLVDLMLEAFPEEGSVEGGVYVPAEPSATLRQQNGLLSFLGDVLKHLGPPLAPSMPRLVGAVVSIACHASSDDNERAIRRLGLRRLGDVVRYSTEPDWSVYAPAILTRLVHPRLVTLAEDSVQAPSALLDLVRAWVDRRDTQLVFLSDAAVLRGIYACLGSASIKPPVAHAILDIAEKTLASDDEVREAVVRPSVEALLSHLSGLVSRTVSSSFTYVLAGHLRDELLRREIALLSTLGPYMTRASDAASVIGLLVPLMRHSARAVPERTKLELLRTFETLLPLAPLDGAAFKDLYTLFCRLGAELRFPGARTQYAAAFGQLVPADASLARVASWVADLNAYSAKTLGEIDFDRRLAASDAILAPETVVTIPEWHALLFNALFFITDTEELAMRTTGAAILQRFVKEAKSDEAVALAHSVLLPGIRRRLHAKSELVRKEVFTLLGLTVVELAPKLPQIQELECLLAGGDEEASVFTNLYHIQAHRRTRALQRIAQYAEQGLLRSKTLSDLFVPMAWYDLLPNASGGIDMNRANDALACIRRICAQLQWSHYYHWLSRFMKEMKEHAAKEATSVFERLHVRGTVGVLEAFHFEMEEGDAEMQVEADDAEAEGEAGEAGEGEDAGEGDDNAAPQPAVSAPRPPPSPAAIAQIVTEKILPQLHSTLDTKDEERVPARLPLLVGAARVAQHLPHERRRIELFKTFSALAMALRSKLQSTRDTTREVALQLVRAIGAQYFAPVVRELRRLLTRGPQKAVCAYTVHSLLVALSTPTKSAAPLLTLVDDGVPDIVAAAVEDIFGETSEDRTAVENKTKVRELRQSKSLDTVEQLARLCSPTRLNELLYPLRDVMSSTGVPKTLHIVEECLHRIASGVNANEHLDADALLVLCHTLIARGVSAVGVSTRPTKRRKDKAEVQGTRKEAEAVVRDHLTQNAHLFVALGLDMLTTALRRGRFDVHDEATVAKLIPLVPAVGETLYARHAPVVERGLRAAAALSRCPLPNLGEGMPVIQRQILAILRHTGGLHSAVAQAAVRALAVILRECKDAAPQEQQLTELLRLAAPELDEPSVQASVFALLRAIVARAFVVPEIYDVMDRVAELLVTSHDAQVREVCRSLYLQFLLDYPQGKGRLQNQLQFLAKNLAYEVESGRKSVLELLGAVLSKFSPAVVNEHAELFFVALIMQLANDESVACKQQCAKVLGVLLGVLDDPALGNVLRMTHKWGSAPQNSAQAAQLAAVALRVYDVALARGDGYARIAPDALPIVKAALQASAADEDEEPEWRIAYQALQTLQTLLQKDAASTYAKMGSTTDDVLTMLTYPHAWCRIAASRVVGALFAAEQPMEHATHIRAAKQLVAQLHGTTLDDALTLQIVRNLVYLGRVFAEKSVDDEEDEEEEEAEGEAEEEAEEAEAAAELGTAEAMDDESDTDAPPAPVDAHLQAVEAEIEALDTDPQRGADENPLAWLFSKLSHAARNSPQAGSRANAPQRISAILKWFAAIATQLEAKRLEKFLVHILSPVQRVTEDETLSESLRTLAGEVQELVQSRVTPSAFTRAYTHVRQSIQEKRRERKHARLMQGITDPERAAKRRATRNVAKHENRKRKNASFRESRQRNIKRRAD